MIPLYLSMENFCGHGKSELNFDRFSSALIVGIKNNNSDISNGVGKSTIFSAIEFALFGEVDFKVERVVRAGAKKAVVSFDFQFDGSVYRIVRSRTKTTSQLDFYKTSPDTYSNLLPSEQWDNLTGRTPTHTEKEIGKVIKINFKSFRDTIHFVQRDMKGLTTSTPEERKKLLKNSLDLAIYAKMEKFVKERYAEIEKKILVKKTKIESLGNPADGLDILISKSDDIKKQRLLVEAEIEEQNSKLKPLEENKLALSKQLALVESQFKTLTYRKNSLEKDIQSISLQSTKYSQQIQDTIKSGQNLKIESSVLAKELSAIKASFSVLDMSEKEKELTALRSKEVQISSDIRVRESQLRELQNPLPGQDVCSHCKQPITEDYRKEHTRLTQEAIASHKEHIASLQKELVLVKQAQDKINGEISIYRKDSEKLRSLEKDVERKEKEVVEKRTLYASLVESSKELDLSLSVKNTEIQGIAAEIASFDSELSNRLTSQIQNLDYIISDIKSVIRDKEKTVSLMNSEINVLSFQLESKKNDIILLTSLTNDVENFEKESSAFPEVIQAFSSIGIPNLIIQSILEDLQNNANSLLKKFGTGLSVEFRVEKEVKDETRDTLDIIYYLNSMDLEFMQLSGAQKLLVSFALKMGLSTLLQSIMGIKLEFLLLDELDDSLDKSSTDALAQLVQQLESRYKILVITHSDKLKENFRNVITVEQNMDMVSTIIQAA